MKKQKVNTTALTIMFPEKQLQTTKKEIQQVVKTATTDELHNTYVKMAGMFAMFDNEVRVEITKRLAKQSNNEVQTQVGFLKLKERSKYDFNIEGIEKFFAKKKEDISNLFRIDYQVVTKNRKVLQQLIDKGYIAEDKKVNTEVFTTLLTKFKLLAKFVKRESTQYITGL